MLWRGLLVLTTCAGCSACTTTPPLGDGGIDAGVDTSDGSESDGTACTETRPNYVPDGWVTYEDYTQCAGLYIPTDTSQLPTPIAWQDCEPASVVGGCRRIKIDWGPSTNGGVYMATDVAIDAQGHAIALTSRDIADSTGILNHRTAIVADVDGPVYNAVLATKPQSYLPNVYIAPTFNPPRYVWTISESSGFTQNGYLGGVIGTLKPTTYGRTKNGAPWYGVGDLGVLRGYTLLDFITGAPLGTIKGSLGISFDWMFRGYVFWQGNNGRIADVGRWDPDGGAIDFINYAFNPDHAAGDLGTDGTDMVWLEGHGSQTDAGFYSTVDYWTSPYVTDSSLLQPRRLRSEVVTAIAGPPIAVGCGYAAYGQGYGIRVIRLADGWSWFLANGPNWQWQNALALTCAEVFTHVFIAGPIVTIARVALSQLGAGVAPD